MRKLLAITVLLTFILAGCAGQSEKPAVSTDEPKPTSSVENNTVITESPDPTDTPAPTLEPTVFPDITATPEPTATPAPTATPVPHEHVYTGKVTTDAYNDDELPVVTDLWEIPLYENPNNSRETYDVVRDEIKAGKYDKVNFVFSDGEEFRLWNIRVDVEFREGEIASYWFLAPQGKTFSDGLNYHNFVDFCTKEDREVQQMIMGRSAVFQSENADTFGCFGEARINYDDIYRDEVIEVKSENCPVELYKPQLEKYWGYFWHTGLEHDDSFLCLECDYCLAEIALRKLIPSAEESSHHFYSENDEAKKILWNGQIYYKRAVIYQ